MGQLCMFPLGGGVLLKVRVGDLELFKAKHIVLGRDSGVQPDLD
jgi:hypothetical protein